MKKLIQILAVLAFAAVSCEQLEIENPSDDDKDDVTDPDTEIPVTYSVKGKVQKGPFAQGTTISVLVLDDKLKQTGKSYQTKTVDDAGSFQMDKQIEGRFVEITATGYYFNEISGKTSGSTVSLSTLSDLEDDGQCNVNVLTSMSADRIRRLVNEEGLSFGEARKQAEKELLAVFNMPDGVSVGFDDMDISCPKDADAMLLAISATLQGDHTEGELTRLLSKVSSELEQNGAITNEALKGQITASGMTIDAKAVRDNLENFYAASGTGECHIPPFEDYLDINGNGTIDKDDNWLILSQKDFRFSDTGGLIEVELQHNVEYEVVIESDVEGWIRESDGTRAYMETDRLMFTVAPNETYDDRYARIVIRATGADREEYITVSQRQKDAVIISADKFEIGTEGGNIEIEVKSNVDYDVEIEEGCRSWITPSPYTKGLESASLSFSIARNDESYNREGHITVSCGEISEIVTVYQMGEEVLVLGQKDFAVSDRGGTVQVDVTSNVEYDVILPSGGWITETMLTKGIVTNTRTFSVMENSDYDPREAEIVFRARNSGRLEKVRIYQTQKDAIIVARKSYQFGNMGGRIAVDLQTNVEVVAEIPEACSQWIHQSPATKGLEYKRFTFKVDENASYDNREGEIVVRNTDGSISDTIKVYQTQKDAILLTRDKYEFDAKGGRFTVEINANVDFEIQASTTSWVRRVQTKAMSTHTLHYTVLENDMYEPRTASIFFFNRESYAQQAVVRISQEARQGIVIGETEYEVPYLGGEVDVKVQSNVDYDVQIESGSEWISLAPETRALVESTVSFIVAKNDSYKTRTGTVKIFDQASGLSSTVTIKQKPSRDMQTIHIPVAGTLSDIISQEDLKGIVNVKFSGYMNADDVKMLTVEGGPDMSFKVETLDLSEVTFADNILGGFNWLPYLREVKLPSSLKYMEGGRGIFNGCASLTAVDFGENPQLEVLGTGAYQNYSSIDREYVMCGAFSNCPLLTRMEIPSSVTTIKAGAFYNSGLKELVIPEDTHIESFRGYTYYIANSLGGLVPVDYGTFYGCTELETLVIPEKITMLEENAFKGWSGLKHITIPETVKYIIPKGLFLGCGNLETVSLPGSLTAIGEEMFSGCSNLKSFSFAKGYKSIGKDAFKGCESIETIDLEGVTSISDGAFAGCGFTHIRIPDNMTNIPDGLFRDCAKLSKVDFNKTEIIGRNAFADCVSLTDVVIPETVREIGYEAFSCSHYDSDNDGVPDNGCTDKKNVKILATEVVIGGGAFDCDNLESFTIGRNVRSVKRLADISGAIFDPDFNGFIFEEGAVIEEIGIFRGLNISSIKLPSSVKRIAGNGFRECASLTDVGDLLQGIEEIGAGAFAETNIPSVNIPEGVRRIESGAFSDCGLRSFTLPSTLAFLSLSAFNYNDRLVSSTINGGELTLENPNAGGAFGGCPFVSEIVIGKDITSLTLEGSGHPLTEGGKTVRFEEGSRCTRLDGSLFANTESMTTIELPSTLTHIGDRVFYNWRNLERITLPEGLIHLGGAFRGCIGLKHIEIPVSVKTIGKEKYYSTFDGCEFDTFVINAPFNVQNRGFGSPVIEELIINCDITEGMFIPKAKKITIKEGVTSIPAGAFKDNTALTSITLPSTLTSIGSSAFSGCKALTSITLPSTLTSIGSGAFSGCTGLADFEIPEGVTSIGGSAFSGCANLTSVTLPSTLTSIGSYAFRNCESLSSLDIPEGVTSIGGSAFSGCSNLQSITLPSTLTSIGSSAFSGCTGLADFEIPEGVTSIGDGAFYGCINLSSITLPSTLTSYASAFEKSGLKSAIISEGAISVPIRGFSGCANLTSVTLPSTLTSIGSYAFENCESLSSLDIPEGVTSIVGSAFSGCANLTSVTLPSTLTSIGSYAFRNCESLSSLDIPEGVTSIGGSAFSGCSNLQSITLPSTLTSYSDVFRNNKVLKTVVISEGATSVINYAFSGCANLTSVTLPSTLTSIGSYAFENCESLSSINIPDGVLNLYGSTFEGCSSLKHITLPSALVIISASAFDVPHNIEEVYCRAQTPPSVRGSGLLNSTDTQTIYYVPRASLDLYLNHKDWKGYASQIQPYEF